MTTAYSAAIKVTFDNSISTNPEKEIGYEVKRKYTAAHTPFSSGDYSATYSKDKAFDDSTSTYWRSQSTTMPQYIGTDFGTAKTFMKARVYLSSHKPKDYQLQGSNDGTTWTDITSGTFTSTTGWQDIEFSPATYRYWRLYITSRQSTNCYVYELEFYEARKTYDTSGWKVTGYEPSMVPGGESVETEYTIYRITKTEDELSVVLWLDLAGRMLYPQGKVTVQFDGDLRGEGGVSVLPFTETFTPVNITPFFNPHTVERVEIAGVTATATLTKIYYTDLEPTREYVEIASVNVTATLTHIDELP